MSAALIALKFIFLVAAVAGTSITPCSLDDGECVTGSFKTTFREIVNGLPGLGVASSDPIHKDKIIGMLPKLKYTLTDVKFHGLKECEVRDAHFSPDLGKFVFNLMCPRLVTKGYYDANGKLLNLEVFGKGNIEINSYGFNITFTNDIELFNDNDCKQHLRIKDYKLVLNDKAYVTHELSNLFNGDKVRADAVTRIISQNWRAVSEEAEAPAMYSLILVFINNMNKYFETIPLDEIFYDLKTTASLQ